MKATENGTNAQLQSSDILSSPLSSLLSSVRKIIRCVPATFMISTVVQRSWVVSSSSSRVLMKFSTISGGPVLLTSSSWRKNSPNVGQCGLLRRISSHLSKLHLWQRISAMMVSFWLAALRSPCETDCCESANLSSIAAAVVVRSLVSPHAAKNPVEMEVSE